MAERGATRGTPRPARPRVRPALVLVLMLGWPAALQAQVPDTTRAALPDTTRVVASDTTRAASPAPPRPLIGFRTAEPGLAVGDTILALAEVLDATGVLAAVPASFVYDFGTAGWPNAWSPYGLHPHRVALLLDGRPFDDPVTGRPRYDLLPLALLEPLGLQAGRLGTPQAVYAELRPYDAERPLTELRYQAGSTGLQSIMAMHAQRRAWRLLGREGTARVLLGYGGHRTDGEYPGSGLRRMRQLLGRLRYEQPGWSVELSNLHNRRQLGAHGGVLPQPGLSFASVYTRIGADVENEDARRQTIRNDLALTARMPVVPAAAAPLTASVYWTAQTFRYRNPGADTLVAKTNRYGVRVHQDVRLGHHRLRVLAEGWTDRLRRSGPPALQESLGRARSQVHLTLRDAVRLGPADVVAEGGLHATEAGVFPGGAVGVTVAAGAWQLFAEGAQAGQPVAWVEAQGFGRFVQPVESVPDGRVSHGRLGVAARLGAFDVAAFGFAHQASQPLDLYATAQDDSVRALVAASPLRRAGVGGTVGWRRDAARGLYLTATPTLVRFLNPGASPEHARQQDALPAFFAQARLGARALLFNGDLDLDVALFGRFWTSMKSRTLHPPTGLLVIPTADARVFPASGTLDVRVQGGVRGATLFLAYENILSGTQLVAGNLLVPVYPLPERRLRFGVFWPIFD